jgi:hypothetical protein
MYYTSIFASHIGVACMLKEFVGISFTLRFKNNVGFLKMDHNAKM